MRSKIKTTSIVVIQKQSYYLNTNVSRYCDSLNLNNFKFVSMKQE